MDWIIIIIVIIIAIVYWPATVCIVIAYIGYRIYEKNKLDDLTNSLANAERSLNSTQKEIASVEYKKQNNEEKIKNASETKQKLNDDYVETSCFAAFFSEFAGYPLTPVTGLKSLQEQIDAKIKLCTDLDRQNKNLDTRVSQLQRQSKSLEDDISYLRKQINSKRS